MSSRKKKSPQSKSGPANASASWREFEWLVSRIEQTLVHRAAVVTSPDRVRDKITGQLREIDATIRFKLGSTEIVVMLECRERSRVADTLWIEQLNTKKFSVGADKCIAVSNRSFSRGAEKKASQFGIELRTLRSAEDFDIDSIMPIDLWYYTVDLHKIFLLLIGKKGELLPLKQQEVINGEIEARYTINDDFLHDVNGGVSISPYQFTHDIINSTYLDMKKQGKVIPINTPMTITMIKLTDYSIDTSKGSRPVGGGILVVSFPIFFDCDVKHQKTLHYQSGQETLAEASQLSIDTGYGLKEITILKDSSNPEKIAAASDHLYQRSEKDVPDDQKFEHQKKRYMSVISANIPGIGKLPPPTKAG